jgi:hypothetical protein
MNDFDRLVEFVFKTIAVIIVLIAAALIALTGVAVYILLKHFG